jgi:signal transduction histidine kinase
VTSGDRLGLAARAFFLSTVLGLALAFSEAKVLQGTLVLLAIGSVAVAAGRFSFLAPGWVCVVEGLVAASAVGAILPDGALLLPYLIVPALLAGVSSSVTAVVLVAVAEAVGLAAVIAMGGAAGTSEDGIRLAAPWAVASLGAGLIAAWVVQVRSSASHADEASYESARRLLGQLRTVARRLSSGLDPISMAEQVLVATHSALEDTRSALFVRTEGGVLAPLGYQGYGAKQALLPEDHLVERCWAEAEPTHSPVPSGRAATRHRVVLPLRSGSRMIGVVMSDGAAAPSARMLGDLMRELDEQALRLDTALVFDEVRSLATMEERQRLAREIHDGVAQEIASLGYFVDDLSAEVITESQRTKLSALRAEISRVVSELRLSIFDLRSEVSPGAGLGSALSDYVRAVGARSGLTVHLTLDEAPTRLRSEVETELLRIAQEAVTNARKHSAAANLWVDCRIRPPFARICIEDDGRGMGSARPDSYGLKIMRERADRIGAALEIGGRIGPEADKGTRVAVTVGADAAPTA